MKISYGILTHDEGEYIETLLSFLVNNKRPEDEIVVVDDFSTDELTKSILEKYKDHITLHYREFDGDELQRNFLNSKCTGDYILQLDADELLTPTFIGILPEILELNKEVELFIMPRINTVEGLTDEYIKKWNWNVDDRGRINFPDWQLRLYKNSDSIKWKGLLHGKITGAKKYTFLDTQDMFCILHHKKLDRQIKQNDLYDKIEVNGRTKFKV